MKRILTASLLAVAMAAPLAAQAPKGWLERVDRSTSAADPDAPGPIKFVAIGNSLHATNPQAAVYWNPANTITGNYSLKGTFVLQKPSSHSNYYGLVFGGSALEGSSQEYLYFLVAQDGTWIVKHRQGDRDTHQIARAANAAVNKPGADGTSTNALEVRVGPDKVAFLVNGTTVHSAPKTEMLAKTNGIYGIRVNHMLEVRIDGFGATK